MKTLALLFASIFAPFAGKAAECCCGATCDCATCACSAAGDACCCDTTCACESCGCDAGGCCGK